MELRRQHDAFVAALGLAWGREGWGPSVRATGTVAGRAVEVRWRHALFGESVRARVDGAWTRVSGDDELRAHIGG